MKSNLIILVAISFLTFSCKKYYTCECKTEYTSSDLELSLMLSQMNSTSIKPLDKMREKEAKAKCESFNSETNLLLVKTTTKCEIKL